MFVFFLYYNAYCFIRQALEKKKSGLRFFFVPRFFLSVTLDITKILSALDANYFEIDEREFFEALKLIK